jgi:CHAT domain-containing protein/tetratricopeptide (TPR) repeat protein
VASFGRTRLSKLIFLSLLVVGPSGPTSASSFASAQGTQQLVRLERGLAITKSLASGERDEFVVDLRVGEVVIAAVRQRGIDVVLSVIGPDNREQHRVDRPNVEWGREAITILAETAGAYRLYISPLHSVGPTGRYQLEVMGVRRAHARDRQRVEAERQVSYAEVARSANSLEGCRQAVQRFERAASLWRELREPYEESVALYGLALAYRFLGDHEESLRVLQRTLTLARQLGDEHAIVMAESGLAWTHLYLDDYETAASRFRQALSQRGSRDHRGAAGDLFGLGWTDLLLEKPKEALVTFNKALRLRRLVLDRRGEALSLVGVAAALDRLGRWDEAAEMATQALDIHEASPDRYGQADALTVKAWALLHSGHASAALETFAKGVAVRRALEDPAGEAAALYGQAAARHKMGDSRYALELTDRAVILVESVRATRTDHDLRATYFASVQDLYELRIELLFRQYQTTDDLDAARRAFHVSERARARSLLDMMGLRGGVRIAQTVEREKTASKAGAYAGVEPPSVEEVQRALDVDTTMLAYATSSSRTILWLIGHDRFSIYELPPAADIERGARALLESIAVPPSAPRVPSRGPNRSNSLTRINDRARALARLVLPENVARQLQRRIVVVPSGPLQLVPFGILPASAGAAVDGRILLEDHEVVTLPSASVIRRLRRADWRSQPRKTVALFADPVLQADDARVGAAMARMQPRSNVPHGKVDSVSPQENLANEIRLLPRLFSTRWEVREIGRLVPAHQLMLALDFRAARSTIEHLDLSRYQILHFGTHAIVDLSRPDRSGLVLSGVDERGQLVDGFIRAREILDWPLEADLVVLSGCRTGIGRVIRGEGILALSRAFLAAGASRLVMSLWSVDDKATAELMARFYRRMLGTEHLAPAAALRAAQLEIRAEPRWRSPSFWAGFMLQGEWH